MNYTEQKEAFEQLKPFFIELKNDIQNIVTDRFIVSATKGSLGFDSICINIHGRNPMNNIPQNSLNYCNYWIFNVFETPLTFEASHAPRFLKFRKIKGNSLEELRPKILKYFERVRDVMIKEEN